MPNYVQYFGSSIVEGVAESWLEPEMSWVEVEMSWVKVDGARWRWVHGLVIPIFNNDSVKNNIQLDNFKEVLLRLITL